MSIEVIMSAVDAMADAECRANDQMTLGDLLDFLKEDSKKVVKLDTGCFAGNLSSYRGFYRMLAVECRGTPITEAQFRMQCEAAVGAVFQGYKGGDFEMSRDTFVWAAHHGETGDRIVDVDRGNDSITLITARYEH